MVLLNLTMWKYCHSTSIIVSVLQLAKAISSLIVPYSLSDPDHQFGRVAQYAPRYRLAFSLLNEDAVAGDGVLHWNIQRSLKC